MPGVPLKHSTHPPLSLPLDALLSLSLFHPHLLRLVAVNPPPTAESRHDPTTRRTTNSFLCRSRSGFGALSRCFLLLRRSASLVLASTRRLFGIGTCALRARHDDGSSPQHKVTFPTHYFYHTSALYRFLAFSA